MGKEKQMFLDDRCKGVGWWLLVAHTKVIDLLCLATNFPGVKFEGRSRPL